MPKSIYFRWEHTSNGRYYEAYIERDLFGWCLTRVWGRKGTLRGQIRHSPCESFEAGLKSLSAIDKLRYQHGYVMISTPV